MAGPRYGQHGAIVRDWPRPAPVISCLFSLYNPRRRPGVSGSVRLKRRRGRMAYDSRAFRILIASPSDVDEEREIAVRVIQEWNDLYSYTRKVALLPLRWETHTAPEYGTRPQEVINRASVDQCDLLVGIFWTRIGSPTGLADSGTLEEIERVGKAGKPIMLYFSRVEIDPERIDLSQIEKLKKFRENTYPKGLVENYKKVIEFRDKFAKQLELKIRDLQRSDASGDVPVSLEFLSLETGESQGNRASR